MSLYMFMHGMSPAGVFICMAIMSDEAKLTCLQLLVGILFYEYNGSCLIWLIVMLLWVYCEPVVSGLGGVVEVEVQFLDGSHCHIHRGLAGVACQIGLGSERLV